MARGFFGFGANNASTVAIARDAEREADLYEQAGDIARAAKLRAQAAEVRKEITTYKRRGTVKRFDNTGKITRYKNLKVFHKECSKHGSAMAPGAMICDLKAIRCLADGSGMATIRVDKFTTGESFPINRSHSKNGTWRLHFASCKLMKEHLKGRVDEIDAKLDGPRKRGR